MALSAATRIVVVGGARGVGLAVATGAAARGMNVVVGSRTAGSDTVQRTLPQGVVGRRVDASSSESLDEFFAGVGRFDHLVFTAGGDYVTGRISEYTPEGAHRMFDSRFFAAMDAVRAALPWLDEAGSITLTCGKSAFRGGPGITIGSALSAATAAAARSLASELAPIRVNAVALGVANTPSWSERMTPEALSTFFEGVAAKTVLGRVTQPEDIAKAYLYLMDHDYVTGEISVLDGGSLLK